MEAAAREPDADPARQVAAAGEEAEAGEDPAARSHQEIVLLHRLLLRLEARRFDPAVELDAVDDLPQGRHQGSEFGGVGGAVERHRGRGRRRQDELGVLEAAERVLGLAPQELRLVGRAAVDGDEGAGRRRAEDMRGEAADLDQLPASVRHRLVAPRARADVVGELVVMGLVGGDHLPEARRHHPVEHLLEQIEIEPRFALGQERLDPILDHRRHLASEGLERALDRRRDPLTKDDETGCHGFHLLSRSRSGSIHPSTLKNQFQGEMRHVGRN